MRGRVIIAILLLLAAVPVASEGQSARTAFWRSLLIPGWGQRAIGRESSATRFLTAELALWGGYFGLRWLGDVREDNFRSYAAEHARARPGSKGNQYLDDLGFYESVLQHNQFARYEDGPDAELYPEGEEFFWEWDSVGSRERYRELRNSSEQVRRQALYFTGLVVVNHLVSAVHAARSAGRETSATSPALELGYDPFQGEMKVALVRRF